jgi:dihydrodipicolinate synthase/N-acetylneuraminate lyase
MILYNCPGRTGVDMKPETIKLISSHKNVIGVKEATGDLERVKAIRGLCGEDFLIFRCVTVLQCCSVAVCGTVHLCTSVAVQQCSSAAE